MNNFNLVISWIYLNDTSMLVVNYKTLYFHLGVPNGHLQQKSSPFRGRKAPCRPEVLLAGHFRDGMHGLLIPKYDVFNQFNYIRPPDNCSILQLIFQPSWCSNQGQVWKKHLIMQSQKLKGQSAGNSLVSGPLDLRIQWTFGLNKSARLFFWGEVGVKTCKTCQKPWFSVDFHANPIHWCRFLPRFAMVMDFVDSIPPVAFTLTSASLAGNRGAAGWMRR